MTVVVEGNKIVEVKSGFQKGSSTDVVVDLKKKFVLPGLIDMHVHLESQTAKDQFQKRIQYSEADVAFEAQKYANITLMAGFTTVRDLGGSGVNISLRGLSIGVRLLVQEYLLQGKPLLPPEATVTHQMELAPIICFPMKTEWMGL